MMNREEIARKRVEELRKSVARAITSLSDKNEFFDSDCQELDWSPDTTIELAVAIRKLGVVLASLDQWYDDEEKEGGGK